ncbi:MAG: crotonase/enoyl-CoA hydratase family protein [Gammaproteobacteria bacterium]|nr:crotonase/enoyl-CoA hydratase family protein [Gammaproteobacteria bacterium]
MTAELVTVNIQAGVADVRLNRPDKMNALSIPMFDAIAEAGKQLVSNRKIRAVVLSGEGASFCAGLDLENFADPQAFADPFGPGRGGFTPNFYQACAAVWAEVPVPVICALHGVVYGGGLQIALGADIRIAHPGSRLSLMEVKWGLVPDMGASQNLRDLVRLDVAKELMFSGRIVAAEEARQLGLVTRLHDAPREAALKMAVEIASRNPDAVCFGKYLLNNTWHGDRHKGLQTEEYIATRVLHSHNQKEAVMAQLEKRSAAFGERQITDFNDISID